MYRYSARKYNDQLLAMGGLRIGTLHNFRSTEHKKGIADPKEGKKTISHYINNLHMTEGNSASLKNNKDYQSLHKLGFFHADDLKGKDFHVENVSINRKFDHPDCFIFCTSALCSRSTMSEFEGADSCVLIKNIPQFYKALTFALNCLTPVIFRGVRQVSYQEREEVWDGRSSGRHPALIKSPDFRKQGELRAIWQPRFRQPIQPLILGHHALGSFCDDLGH